MNRHEPREMQITETKVVKRIVQNVFSCTCCGTKTSVPSNLASRVCCYGPGKRRIISRTR